MTGGARQARRFGDTLCRKVVLAGGAVDLQPRRAILPRMTIQAAARARCAVCSSRARGLCGRCCRTVLASLACGARGHCGSQSAEVRASFTVCGDGHACGAAAGAGGALQAGSLRCGSIRCRVPARRTRLRRRSPLDAVLAGRAGSAAGAVLSAFPRAILSGRAQHRHRRGGRAIPACRTCKAQTLLYSSSGGPVLSGCAWLGSMRACDAIMTGRARQARRFGDTLCRRVVLAGGAVDLQPRRAVLPRTTIQAAARSC